MHQIGTSRFVRFTLSLLIATGLVALADESRADLILRLDFENGADLIEDTSGDMRVGSIFQVSIGGTTGTLTQAVGDSVVGSSSGDFFPSNSGNEGKAIEFGDDQLPNFTSDDSFAVALWVKPTTDFLSFDPFHGIVTGVAIGPDAAQDFGLQNRGDVVDGDLDVARLDGPFEAPVIDASTNLTAGAWQHVAVVSNGQSNEIQIYYDGALTQSIAHTSGLAFNEFYIGMNSGRRNMFDGRLDDVRIYDSAAVAEVLDLTSSAIARVVVDRDTGSVTLSNPSGVTEQIKSYSITSLSGALDPTGWTSIAATGDGDSGSSVDDDIWTENVATTGELAESTTGSADFGAAPIGLGAAWLRSPFEDLVALATLADDSQLILPVAFEGNGGSAFQAGDLNLSGDVTAADWTLFKAGQGADLSNQTVAQSYFSGDLDGDGDNDGLDFFFFEEAFDEANGLGALASLIAVVPEPSSLSLLTVAALTIVTRRRRKVSVGRPQAGLPRRAASATVAICLAMVLMFSTSVEAQLLVYDGFDTPTLPAAVGLSGTTGGSSSFGFDSNTWLNTTDVPQSVQFFISAPNGMEFPGLKTAEGHATRPAQNGRTALNRQLGATEQALLTTEGGEFWFSSLVAQNNSGDDGVILFSAAPIEDYNDPDFADGSASPFDSIGFLHDDDADTISAVYTDGGDAVFSTGTFAIGDATEPHLVIGHMTWGTGEGDHQLEMYAMGIEDVVNPLAPLSLPAAPFASLTVPSADFVREDLQYVGLASKKIAAFDEIRFGMTAEDVIPSIDRLTLLVDLSLGTVTLKNDTDVPFDLDYIEISSESGSLDEAGWTSLSDNGSFPTGDGSGNGWEEGGNNGANKLIESFLSGATEIAPGGEISLGAAFSPQAAQDLVLAYHLDSLGPRLDGGRVEYVGLKADFDQDNDVDGDDLSDPTKGFAVRYGSDLDGANFLDWQREVGSSVPLSAIAAVVPEPTTGLMIVAMTAICGVTCRRRSMTSWKIAR